MENGYDAQLAEKFSGLGVNQHSQQHDQPHDQNHSTSSNNDSLFQVMKAVEAAEATIKQQVLSFHHFPSLRFLGLFVDN